MKKTISKIATFMAAAAMTFAFAACSDDDNYSISKAEVDIDQNEVGQLSPSSSVKTFNLKTDDDAEWVATVEWDRRAHRQPIYCYPDSGVGSATLKIATLDNRTQQVRKANLIIRFPKDESKNITIPITQKRAEVDNSGEDIIDGNMARGIGYGYNAYKGYCENACMINPILEVDRMYDEKKLVYDFSGVSIEHREESGASVEELARKLNATAHASMEYNGFAGSVDAQFNGGQKSTSSNEFAWMDINVRSCTARLNGTLARLIDSYITQEAYEDINGIGWVDREGNESTDFPSTDEGFRKLVQQYGTHLVIGAVLGGQLRTSVVCNTSKINSAYNASVALQASYNSDFANIDISATAKAQQSAAVSSNHSGFYFNASVRGGGKNDGTFAAMSEVVAKMSKARQGTGTESSLTDDTDVKVEIEDNSSEYEKAGQAWINSLSTGSGAEPESVLQNVVIIDFTSDDQLLPLYELVNRRRDGGEDRYTKFRQWYENTMKNDPEILSYRANLSSYINVPPTKIDPMPDLTQSRNSESLVQDIYQVNGQHVARVCSEFIPVINPSKRVNVIYPIVNGKPRYNLGIFCGDESSYPAQVSWGYEADPSVPIITTIKGLEKGARKVAYLRGNHLTLEPDSNFVDSEYLTTRAKPYVLEADGRTYTTVKINDFIYTRDMYHGTTFGNGTSYRQASSDYHQEVFGLSPFASYYRVKAYTRYQKAFGGFAPTGWGIPYVAQFQKMIDMIANIPGNKPNGSIGKSFVFDGVYGFNFEKGGFYLVDNEWPNLINNYTICNGSYLYLGCLADEDKTFWDDVVNDEKNNSVTDANCPALVVNSDAGTATVAWWTNKIKNYVKVTEWDKSTWKNPMERDPDGWLVDDNLYTVVQRRGYYVYYPVILCEKAVK